MATNQQVGIAFANGNEAKGHSLRTENINGVTFAISYRTPVAATDGNVTLKTIDRYSVTTTQQMGQLRTVGEGLPTTEKILKDISNGYITFAHAVKLGEAAMNKVREREFAKGASITKLDTGAYRIDDTGRVIEKREGALNFWVIVSMSTEGVETSEPFRTLKEARLAALRFDDVHTPFINHWGVTHGDFA